MSIGIPHESQLCLPQNQLLALDRVVVRALVLTPRLDEVLFCLRAGTDEWELPGGECLTVKDGCRREVKEETAIDITLLSDPVQYDNRLEREDGIDRHYKASVILGQMIGGPGLPQPQNGEASRTRWLPLDAVETIINDSKMRFRPDTVTALEALRPEIRQRYDYRLETAVHGIATAILRCNSLAV